MAQSVAIAEIWPASAGEPAHRQLVSAIAIASERDLNQDVDFGVRQLADIAIKAMSPGVNDPMTAVTCIGYLRSILVRLVGREPPAEVLTLGERHLQIVVRRRGFDEYLDPLQQIGRYAAGDAWVAGELLTALNACARAGENQGAGARFSEIRAVAGAIAESAIDQAGSERDRRTLRQLAEGLDTGAQ